MKKDKIIADTHPSGMRIRLSANDGSSRHLMIHRYNPDLYRFLRDGKSIADLYRYKPGRNKREQKLYNSLRHVAKLVECVEMYDCVA